MRNVMLAVVIGSAFLLGAVVRGEAGDAPAKPSDAEVTAWVETVADADAKQREALVRKLVAEADRAVPLLCKRLQQQATLTHTLTVFDVRDIRDTAHAKLDEVRALLTASSVRWFGDGKLIVRASRADADKVAALLERLRASAPK